MYLSGSKFGRHKCSCIFSGEKKLNQSDRRNLKTARLGRRLRVGLPTPFLHERSVQGAFSDQQNLQFQPSSSGDHSSLPLLSRQILISLSLSDCVCVYVLHMEQKKRFFLLMSNEDTDQFLSFTQHPIMVPTKKIFSSTYASTCPLTTNGKAGSQRHLPALACWGQPDQHIPC